jgi:hypothetical protein
MWGFMLASMASPRCAMSEIFMYLDKAPISNDWRGVVIYPRRSLDPADEPQNAR